MSVRPRSHPRRESGARRRLRAALVVAPLLVALAGCATWRGARLYQSGTRALASGDLDRALVDLQQAARLVPEASEVQNSLGLAWLATGDETRALDAFDRAIALDCDNRAAALNRARLEARLRERAILRVSVPELPGRE